VDAGNFPNYERIINTTPLPRTRQERGWFYLELAFSPNDTTKSLACPMRLEFGAFGDVCRIEIKGWNSRASAHARDALLKHLPHLVPPASGRYDASQDTLTLHLVDNKAAREKNTEGLLIFNSQDELVCLATGLK